MTKNIGNTDRIIRAIIGLLLVLVIIFGNLPLWSQIALGLIALFSFYQALMSWCLLYQLMGKNTCPTN